MGAAQTSFDRRRSHPPRSQDAAGAVPTREGRPSSAVVTRFHEKNRAFFGHCPRERVTGATFLDTQQGLAKQVYKFYLCENRGRDARPPRP